jgi:uncharacterized protein (TIGR00730 family)
MNRIENPAKIRKICVYCGSGPGTDPAFVDAARAFGAILAQNRIGLVYGGGTVGMMGELSDAVKAHGGEVIGIIPDFLVAREHAVKGEHGLIVTRDMHERKRKMYELADAFVALPGGVGTLEEIVEQMTWAQLGRHRKPILIANLKGFWNGLLGVLDHMEESGFIHSAGRLNFLVADTVEDILPALQRAIAAVSEEEKAGERETVERL